MSHLGHPKKERKKGTKEGQKQKCNFCSSSLICCLFGFGAFLLARAATFLIGTMIVVASWHTSSTVAPNVGVAWCEAEAKTSGDDQCGHFCAFASSHAAPLSFKVFWSLSGVTHVWSLLWLIAQLQGLRTVVQSWHSTSFFFFLFFVLSFRSLSRSLCLSYSRARPVTFIHSFIHTCVCH